MTDPVSQPGSVGSLIRAVRLARHWRQIDLALRAGVSLRTITRIERDDLSHVVSGEVWERIAPAFGLHLHRRRIDPMETLQSALTHALQAPPAGLEHLRIAASHLARFAPIINALRMRPDGQLLIAGGSASDYPPNLQAAPRILLWESQATNAGVRRMPPNVVAVVFARFLSHPETSALLRDAAKIGARFHRETLTVGTIAELADEAGLLADPIQEEPRTMNASNRGNPDNPYVGANGKTAKGALNAFLEAEANPSPEAAGIGGVGEEIKRLTVRAKAVGMPTTEMSIAQAYRLWRNARRKAAASAAPAPSGPGLAGALAPILATLPTLPTPPTKEAAQAPAAVALNADLDALMSTLDATATGLRDALAGLDLIRDQLLNFGPMLAAAQASQLEVSALRDKLNRIAAAIAPPTN